MQFTQNKVNNYFFSQPHQSFFILAFVSALVLMLLFLFSYKGLVTLNIDPTSFHAYGFSYLLFTPAFFGFLFTTFPRFSSTPAIEKSVYLRVFTLLATGSLLFVLGALFHPFLLDLGLIILFVGHLFGFLILKNIYDLTEMDDKYDIYWLTVTMGFGLVGHLLFIVGTLFYMPLVSISMQISTYLYLFLLTYSVAQRMIPFFSHCVVEKNTKIIKQLLILLVLHILLETVFPDSSFVIDLAIAGLITKELVRWKLPFPNPNPMLWILHLSLFWVPLSFFLSALAKLTHLLTDISFLALGIHALLLGFVLTALIGFGTRVTLGHSGNTMQADKWTKVLFIGTQVLVLVRILTSFVFALGFNFMILFDISALVWLLLFISWAVRFFAVLIQGKNLTK
ncbi:MAG: NnrS family protein [Sulfurovum sp.]|nr:NnrS family protein [Sulfurovum sp.]